MELVAGSFDMLLCLDSNPWMKDSQTSRLLITYGFDAGSHPYISPLPEAREGIFPSIKKRTILPMSPGAMALMS